MKNKVQDGTIVNLFTSTAVAPGDLVNEGALTGVAVTAAAANSTVPCAVEGVFGDLPIASAPATGGLVYFDAATGQLTSTASGKPRVGHFLGNGLVRLAP